MQPIRYINHQNTVWYNVADFTSLLLDTHSIWRVRPSSLHKRHRSSKTPDQVVLAKINQLSPVYQMTVDQELYADWVAFEYIYRALKPFLVQPADWTNPGSLFHRLRVFIDLPKQLVKRAIDEDYFREITIENSD